MTVVDVHTHFFPERWPDLAERFGTPGWPWLRHDAPGRATVMVGDEEFRPITAACWDPAARLADMDRDGVDVQVVSATPLLFSYGRPAAQAREAAMLFNDKLLELCAGGQGRLVPICQVPLQDPDAACEELSRCLDAGHRGVEIGNHVGGRELDDEGIVAFLRHCADLGAAVLVHPWDMLAPERTARWMAAWTVAMPAETQLGIVSLILGGAFDRLPASLRLCFTHGGGSFCWLLGRLENAWRRRGEVVRGHSTRPPSAYLDRFSVDSAVFDQRALRLLVDVMGSERVLLGSDYPYPLGEERAGQLVRSSSHLDGDAKARVLGGNALAFLGMEGP